MVSPAKPDLWTLVLDRPLIAATDLADALQLEVHRNPLDFRTRLLIRDSLDALDAAWGGERFGRWLADSPECGALDAIRRSSLGAAGFPYLVHRIMEPTKIETVQQFLRDLGQALSNPVTIQVGGSIALMLQGALSRRTDDIDVVNEVPIAIRSERELLEKLAQRYALHLTHFQSHFLPSGWESRLRKFDTFGNLEVQLVNSYDIVLSKLFSAREKDLDDLRIMMPSLDKQQLIRRLIGTTATLRREPKLFQHAEKNWYIVFGEPLPT